MFVIYLCPYKLVCIGFMQFVSAARVNMLGVVPSIVKAWKSIVDKQQILLTQQQQGEGKLIIIYVCI